MIIIIGAKDKKMLEFSDNYIEDAIIIDKMCSIKSVKGKVKIIVPFAELQDNGVFSGTSIWLDELLMTLNVEELIINKKTNENLLDKICLSYQVPYRFFNL